MMIQLILLIFASALLALAYQKKIHQILPIATMAAILVMYIFALFINSLKICTSLSLIILLLFAAISFRNKDRKTLVSKINISELLITPQISVLIITCIVFFFLFSNRKVFHWDDLSYWGIYAKDLFYLGKLPVGVENCTISYKDYTPLMQLAQTFFICFNAVFAEERLFQINICFLYMLMLPFLDFLDNNKKWYKKAAIILLYIIFPHIFTTQFYYKLGIDYLISVLFGYGLYIIKNNRFRIAGFRTVSIIIVSSFLTLIKNSGIILSLFLILFYILCTVNLNNKTVFSARDKKSIFNSIIVVITPILFYYSWTLWSKKTGNSGYSSEKINSNIRNFEHSFPSYTGTVIKDYIKHIFTYPLTRDRIGITAFIIILCIIFMYFIQKKHLIKQEAETAAFRRMHYLMLAGMVLFCLAHIYMYIFVFDDWEALGLLEYDRYICQYLAGVFFYYACSLWEYPAPYIPFYVLFIILLPYPSINQYLVPKHYDVYYETTWKPFRDYALNEIEKSKLKEINTVYSEDNKLMLIGNAWLDEIQYFTYELVPQPVAIIANIPALENGSLYNYICTLSENFDIQYIYVTENSEQYYNGSLSEESKKLTLDHNPLTDGKIYVREDYKNEIRFKEF